MSSELTTIALTYAAMALGAFLAHRQRWQKAAMRAGGRGAWCAMWLFASLHLLYGMLRDAPGSVELRGALAAGAWSFALALVRHPLARVGVAVPALALGLVQGLPAALMMACACLFGDSVSRAMQSGRWLTFRLLAYWLSFVGTFAVLVPRMLLQRAAPDGGVLGRLPLALLLAAMACGLAVSGTLAFARTGGTPEPIDPPRALVTNGIYAHLRHPLQLAEILFVGSAIALFPTAQGIAYALCFALFMVLPMRLWEERQLLARWGAAYHSYQRSVPAYLPRVRGRGATPVQHAEARSRASGAPNAAGPGA